MTTGDSILFTALTMLIAIAAHLFIRRVWLAPLVAAALASLGNIVYELINQYSPVRPDDAFFWIPMVFLEGIVVALPAVIVVAIFFYLLRRSRQAHSS